MAYALTNHLGHVFDIFWTNSFVTLEYQSIMKKFTNLNEPLFGCLCS